MRTLHHPSPLAYTSPPQVLAQEPFWHLYFELHSFAASVVKQATNMNAIKMQTFLFIIE
jgi:hypothetical protein